MMNRTPTIMLSLFAALSSVSGCKDIECGDGTIERDGTCKPATLTTGAGMCGPFTELQGDRCEPLFPPTECDPATTTPSVDPETGVTTCVGTGGGGCSAKFACPMPTMANHMTICGQLYDFETMTKYQAQDAAGAPCDLSMPSATGPCGIGIQAFDAVQFASGTGNPLPATYYIDDCGRYRLIDIDTNGTGPFIGLGIDDIAMPKGPAGLTVTVGVATPKSSPVIENFDGFIVKASTVGMWQASGGPSLANGIYAALYRAHKLVSNISAADRAAPQAGVQFAKMGTAVSMTDDYYFSAALTTNTTIDPAANVTGANGTALVTNRSLADGPSYDGIGGLGTGCRWEPHAGATVPGVVFAQVFRKNDNVGTPGSCTD